MERHAEGDALRCRLFLCVHAPQRCQDAQTVDRTPPPTVPTPPPDSPLLPQRAASEASHPLHSGFLCVELIFDINFSLNSDDFYLYYKHSVLLPLQRLHHPYSLEGEKKKEATV